MIKYFLIGELILIGTIVVVMIRKRKAAHNDPDDGYTHEEKEVQAEMNLPEEERWE